MDQIIDRAIEQNPHSSELLKALKPIIILQRQLTDSITLPKVDYSSVDQEKLQAGVSVIQQINLFTPADPLKEIALSLSEAVKEGMPKLAGDIDRLSELIQNDKLYLADYFEAHARDENKTMEGWKNNLKISPSNTSFLLSLVARVLLERRAKEATEAVGEFAWRKAIVRFARNFQRLP